MSAHRVLRDLYRGFESVGPGIGKDPGNAGTISPTVWGQQFLIVTAGAETRTLARPDKAGILVSIVLDTDGGDLTLTVTGGYNADGDTSITFADAGDLVVFLSVKTGTTYQWSAITQEGTNIAVETGSFDALTVANTAILRGDTFFAQDAPTAEADGNQAIAAADFVNGIVVHTVTTGRTLTTPTGAQIAAVLPAGVTIGDAFRLHVITIGTGADDISTLTAGDGNVTFVGNVTVGPDASTFNGYGTWIFRMTGATSFVGYRVG